MKPLEQQSLGNRIFLTIIIVVLVLILLALIGWISGRWEEAQARTGPSLVLTLPPSKWDMEIIGLDKQALREGYVQKLKLLFDVWVREGRENPERPLKGAAEARRGFVEIMQAIEIREQAIKERESK